IYPRLLERFSTRQAVEAMRAEPHDLPDAAEQLAREVTLFGTYDEGAEQIAAWFAAGADSVQLVLPPGRPEAELAQIVEVAAALQATTNVCPRVIRPRAARTRKTSPTAATVPSSATASQWNLTTSPRRSASSRPRKLSPSEPTQRSYALAARASISSYPRASRIALMASPGRAAIARISCGGCRICLPSSVQSSTIIRRRRSASG